MFDITGKKREKLVMREMDAPGTMNWEDTDPLERQLRNIANDGLDRLAENFSRVKLLTDFCAFLTS